MNNPPARNQSRPETVVAETLIPRESVVRALILLRWLVIAAILVITIIWPFVTRTGHPAWAFVLLFGAYNFIVYVLRTRVSWLRSHAHIAIVDLPVVAFLYYMDQGPDGPLFVFFYLAVVTAALSMSLRQAVAYVVMTVAVVVVIAPTHPGWTDAVRDPRQLGVRVLVLAVLGIGVAVMADRLARALLAARASRDEAIRLRALQEVRRDFIATVAHDLKTPLTSIRSGVGLLGMRLSDGVDASERSLLSNVSRNAEWLGVLIDDIISFNQLETNTLEIHCAPIDLREVVAEAISTVHLLLQEKGQQLEVDISGPLPVSGDAQRLEQVIVNLLANAHHHTPSGTHITITGAVQQNECLLIVRDTGPGILEEDLGHIFERFHRSMSLGSGSGLGLAIAQSIVELHGGRIWAESEWGQGASFYVALPRENKGVHQ